MSQTVFSDSNIRSIAYHPERSVLEIRLHSGGTYRYQNVPLATYEQFIAAKDKDEYLTGKIKPKYRCNMMLTV